MSNDLLSRLQEAKTDEEREWIVLEFSLQNLEKDVQDAIWAAAIPHWFDENFLSALLQKPKNDADNLYKRMKELSFVERFPERGLNIHERTRKLLLQYLWKEDSEKFGELSRRAAEYSAGQNQDDTSWRVEWVYHLLVADPETGANQIQTIGWYWNNEPRFAYEKVDSLVRVTSEHLTAGRLQENCAAWVHFFDALVDRDYFRHMAAKEKFLNINLIGSVDKGLETEVNFRIGNLHVYFYEYQEAQVRLEKALSLCKETNYRVGEANCLANLGDLNYQLAKYEDARKLYEQAIPLYKETNYRVGEANCLRSLGDICYQLAKDEDARKLYEQALSLYKEIGSRLGEANCLKSLGDINYQLNKDEDARKLYEQALSLYKEIGARIGEANCLSSLGDINYQLNKDEDARKLYKQALSLYKEIGARLGEANCLKSLGDLYKELLKIEMARKYYKEAIFIFNEIKSPSAKEIQSELDALDLKK